MHNLHALVILQNRIMFEGRMAYSENNATESSWGLGLAELGKMCSTNFKIDRIYALCSRGQNDRTIVRELSLEGR